MRYFGLLNPRLWQREGERWIDARPPGPDDGRDPRPIACGNSRLVVARDERVFCGDGRPSSDRLRELFAGGLLALTGQSSERAAWRSLMPGLAAGDVVGLKINTVAVYLVPHQGVIDAIVASLASADVAAKNIVVWDNLGRLGPFRRAFYGNLERPEGAYYQGMTRAGFVPDSAAAPRILCTVPVPPGTGYDRSVRASIPSRGLNLPVTRILTRICDHVINVPVPKDHRVTGMTCALKNFYGSVPLWDAFRPTHADGMHANNGDPCIAELYANPAISGKVRLHVCDGLRAICDGGPWGEPQLSPASLLLSEDPVAMDAYVLAMIDAARTERGMERIARRARYIESAARLGLGTSAPESIELVNPFGNHAITWPAC